MQDLEIKPRYKLPQIKERQNEYQMCYRKWSIIDAYQ